jgi:hypothetical protein
MYNYSYVDIDDIKSIFAPIDTAQYEVVRIGDII